MSRKTEIQTAAARLFGEKGFAASSVRDIAHAVGLGAASLYNHIGSKDELLTTICFRCADQFLEGMRAIEAQPGTALRKIEALIALQVRIALEDRSSVTVFNDEWRHLQEPHLSRFKELRRNYERRYLRIIRDGVEAGDLRDIDPYVMYQWILSSLRWLHVQDLRKTKLTETGLIQQITPLIINGIEA